MEARPIQVYYGAGSGKSSAALGNAIRCASEGKTVYIIQFLKGQWGSEYLTKLEPELKVFRFERCKECFDDLSEEAKDDEKQNMVNGMHFAKKALVTGECDMLVLDEILGAVSEGLVTEEELKNVLSVKSPMTTVILTGRSLPDAIRQLADDVYNIFPEKSHVDIGEFPG